MAQVLRVLAAALREDWSSVPTTLIRLLQLHGIDEVLFWPLQLPTHMYW